MTRTGKLRDALRHIWIRTLNEVLRHRIGWRGVRSIATFPCLIAVLAIIPLGAIDARPFGDFTHFQHHHWTLEDGSPPDIWSIAQSPEGFLWLGTGAGLYKFDGVRFEHFQPLPGEHLSGSNIVSVVETKTGDLWIGYYSGGVSLLRHGHIRNFAIGAGPGAVNNFIATSDKDVWANSQSDAGGGLSHFDGRQWHLLPVSSGLPHEAIYDIAIDSAGNIWASTAHQLFVKPARSDRFFATGQTIMNNSSHLAAAPDGGIWLVARYEQIRLVSMTMPASKPSIQVHTEGWIPSTVIVYFDRDGAVWGRAQAGGVFHVAPADRGQTGQRFQPSSISYFTFADGLSTNHVGTFFQDREGTIWVSTNGGLDRFRRANIVPETELPQTSGFPFLADMDPVGNARFYSDHFLYGIEKVGTSRVLARSIPLSWSICSDGRGTTWSVTKDGTLSAFRDGHSTTVTPVRGSRPKIDNCATDPAGRLWISDRRIGLLRQTSAFGVTFERPQYPQGEGDFMFFAPTGDLWAQDAAGRLTLYAKQGAHTFTDKDGPAVGKIQAFFASGGDVFVSGDLGVARYGEGRFHTLLATDYPFMSRVSGIARSGQYSWFFGINGLARVDTRALQTAFARPGTELMALLFDSRDGLPGSALQDWQTNTLRLAGNGRLWMLTNNGVASIDPDHLVSNPYEPPVEIRSITAGGRVYPHPFQLTLPKGVTDVQIDYAALSLAVPERVRVLYRLEGRGNNWIDPGSRRQAFYTNLEPGSYQFQIIASNDAGVWNRTGARVTFTITPVFVQTLGFKFLCAALLIALIWILYLIRIRATSRSIQLRLEERMEERERIARELHDTLLQGIQGLILRFQAVANRLPKDNEQRRSIDRALDSAETIIVDGRNSLTGLRTATPSTNLRQHFEDFLRKQSLHSSARFVVEELGEARALVPLAHHEVTRIGEEAAFNALRHGDPTILDMRIEHCREHFTVAVHDNGKGIEPIILKQGGKVGHFGLASMRERARRIQARLTIRSIVGEGTEITLRVPSRHAYGNRKDSWTRRSWSAFRERLGPIR